MARTIPTTEPTRLTAGDSWEWDVERFTADYPAPTWTLTYRLVGPTPLSLAASDAGDETFEVRALPAVTKKALPGTYKLVGLVDDGTDRFEVFSGVLVIDPDPATTKATTSHASTTLAIIEAKIEGRLTADLESYQIEGRAVQKIPISELTRLRGIYADKVRRERNPGSFLQSVGVRFG